MAGPVGGQKRRRQPHPADQPGSAREKSLPVALEALVEKLTAPNLWPAGRAAEARRFFRYLVFWRRHAYGARVLDLQRTYEPFDPDAEAEVIRTFSGDDRIAMHKRLLGEVRVLLERADYNELPSAMIATEADRPGPGVRRTPDLSIFDAAMVFARGRTSAPRQKPSGGPSWRQTGAEALATLQRVFVAYKIKPFDAHVAEVMAERKCERRRAERVVRGLRGPLPSGASADHIIMKLFRDVPQADLDTVLPNTRVGTRRRDVVFIGAMAVIAIASTAAALATAGTFTALPASWQAWWPASLAASWANLWPNFSPPAIIWAALAVLCAGIGAAHAGAVLRRRALYFARRAGFAYAHILAGNRMALTALADKAADDAVKEELLLYSVLAKQTATVHDLDEIDAAIERHLKTTYGVDAAFDIDDALKRLIDDGIVHQLPDGTLDTLPPALATVHIDALWDAYLDNMPDVAARPSRSDGWHAMDRMGATP